MKGVYSVQEANTEESAQLKLHMVYHEATQPQGYKGLWISSKTLDCGSLLKTFSLQLSSAPMHSSSCSNLSNADTSVAFLAGLASDVTPSLASHLFEDTFWTIAGTSGDIAAHPKKMASDASPVAAAASATVSITSLSVAPAGLNAAGVHLEACHIVAARLHSSSVRLCQEMEY